MSTETVGWTKETAQDTTCSSMVRYIGPGAMEHDMRPCALPLHHSYQIPHEASADGGPLPLPDERHLLPEQVLEAIRQSSSPVPKITVEGQPSPTGAEFGGLGEDVSGPDTIISERSAILPPPPTKSEWFKVSPGITRTHAQEALALGWTQSKLKDLDTIAKLSMIRSTEVTKEAIYLGVGGEPTTAAYLERPISELSHMLKLDPMVKFTAFTDGSGTTSEKPAGMGIVLVSHYPSYLLGGECEASYTGAFDTRLTVGESCGNGTNNHAELSAIWRALTLVPDLLRPLVIRPDSLYAIGCASNPTWKIKANQDLVLKIRADLAKRPNVTFEHVKGHSGHPDNELADVLANKGRNGEEVSKTVLPWTRPEPAKRQR